MESITKNRQSLETLRAVVARAFGEDEVRADDDFAEELGHGWFNVAYRIGLRSGRDVVLKIAPPEGVEVMTYERGMMRNELDAIAIIQEHTTVPVPRVEFVDTTRELIDADWFVMAFVDADNVGVEEEEGAYPPELVDSYREQLGALTRRLNAIVGPHFGPLRGTGFPTWRAAFGAMFEDVLRDGERAGVDLGRPYDEFRAAFAAGAASLDEVVEPRFVEWDLWMKNVMGRDGRITALIDHERAFYGDPVIEAVFLGAGDADFGDVDAYLRGYGRGPLTALERQRRGLYTLYLFLVMTIETSYRGHEDPAQYDGAVATLGALMAAHDRTA